TCKVQSSSEPQNCQDTRPRGAPDPARARRQGDRVKLRALSCAETGPIAGAGLPDLILRAVVFSAGGGGGSGLLEQSARRARSTLTLCGPPETSAATCRQDNAVI